MKTALITGVTGQDGSYLAELLISKGYRVVGIVRRSSTFNTSRIDHLIDNPEYKDNFEFFRGDLADGSSLARILRTVRPDEIYNLAAQSHVKVSFEIPEYTADIGFLGYIRLLEAVRDAGLNVKIYQACSSEMFGDSPPPQDELTAFKPRSPYAVAKLASYNIGCIYREAYGLWITHGILFNHESPRRGETFVTRKITRALAKIKLGRQDRLFLGNLDAKRDWGFAPEYMEAIYLMMQYSKPEDFVIATGEMHSVKDFVEEAFSYVGLNWKDYVDIDASLFRPAEVNVLCGNANKAEKLLSWKAKTKFKELVKIMVESDLAREVKWPGLNS